MPGKGNAGKHYGNGSTNERSRTSESGFSSEGYNNVEDFYNTMTRDLRTEDQKQLQEAQVKSFLGGVPIVGGFVKGVESAKQMEDLYNSTGKTPAYPALSGTGFGGVASAASNLAFSANRIANGFNDLYHFYSGEPDAFRGMMNNSYM